MAGFPLMAFGAGLGKWAENYRAEQEAKARNAMLELTLAKYRQEQQDRQDKLAGAKADWELPPVSAGIGPAPAAGGGGGASSRAPFAPFGSGLPAASSMAPARDSQPQASPLASVDDRWLMKNLPMANGPAPAVGTLPWGNTESPNPVGSLEPGAPGARPGWAPGGPPGTMNAAGITDAGQPPGPPRSGINAPPQMAQAQPEQQSASGAPPDLQKMLDAVPKPDLRSRFNEQELKARINQAYPTLAPTQKLEIFKRETERTKLAEADQAKLAMKDYDTRLQAVLETWKEQNTRSGRALEGGELIVVDGTLYRQKGGGAAPVTAGGQPVTGATRLPAEGAAKSSRNIEVTDAEGKVVFSGAAHQGPKGWIADKDQQPVAVPDDGALKILGPEGRGRRADAQIQSMIGSTSELVGEAKNLMELPGTSVAGMFQGLQSIPAAKLGDALRRTLANKLTAEENTDMTTSFQGVARALATIEAQGRATGLVGLTAMSQGLMPQTNDTVGNILRKYATIRQIAERNTDAILASPNATLEQKNLLKQLRDEMAEAIPFTVSEVNKLQHGDKESFAQIAGRMGLGAGAIPPAAVAELKKDASPQRRQQFDEIFGAGAAARALGK